QSPAVQGQGPIVGSAPGYGQFVHGHGDFAPGYGNSIDQIKSRTGHRDFQAYQGFTDHNFGYEGGYYAGPQGYYTDHDRVYSGGGGCECGGRGCHHCGLIPDLGGSLGHGPNGFPTHYQTYGYHWPQNMVYPNAQVPAGMVQYPYYTFRGPTDFFMK
ncbi:MAG: hypothetical protein FJ267_14040, partial [Planctomycetes bacterium]|nr:hypothetical protein [Planctomycetota bacterium]